MARVIVESTANGTTGSASGWTVWQDFGGSWVWSAFVAGETRGGGADSAKAAEALATQAFGDLQAEQRRRTLRSV